MRVTNFFVASGSGILHVNGVKLEIGKGSFGWLHTYHIYQFEPDGDDEAAIHIDTRALLVLNHLFSHYREPLTTQDTAKALYMKKNSVNPLLKENFGLDHRGILTELRMTYSESLLVNSRMPVADIAFACGYNSSHTFIRIFSERHKMTPGEYRRFSVYGGLEIV